MEPYEKLKKNRTVLRTAVSKLINQIETIIKSDAIDIDTLEELSNLLNIKAESLKTINDKIEPLVKIDEYETEIETTYEYSDKISSAIFRSQKKIKENKSFINSNLNNNLESKSDSVNENKRVKLPKLNIQKFNGDYTQFHSFWNTFKTSIDENNSLSKVEKFQYLKSYLFGSAASSIEGFEISDLNYDSALIILKERFGQKDVIINHHMTKLLNLTPVYKSNDIYKLKRLHNEIEINVRSLTALGLEPKNYSSMLIPVVLKIIPMDLSLEYNRQNANNSTNCDIFELLTFLQSEIKCRENTFSLKPKIFEFDRTKPKAPPMKTEVKSLCEFMTLSDDGVSLRNCLFCNQNHSPELCGVMDIESKRNKLKSDGRCYLCLEKKHVIKQCNSKLCCAICKGKHNKTICFKSKFSRQNKEPATLKNNKSEVKEEIISAISHNGKNKILLQTCCVKIKKGKNDLIVRLLLDCASMRTFIKQDIANKLNLKVIRREKLSVFTFGNKTPIEKYYNVVNIVLENKNLPNTRLTIEALVTDEISGSDIPPPEVKELGDRRELNNLTLADSPECKEPISLLIGADYYYEVVTGNIKHLNKTLVAVDTIFGWCLLGKKIENQSSFSFSVMVEENVISEQIKKFWDIETSGLVDLNRDSDPSKNEIIQQFESSIKYENKRYMVRLPWKADIKNLEDNRKIADERFSRLKKRFVRNPKLFLEYKEVLDDYLKQGIIELVQNPEQNENITFYLPHREIIKKDRMTSRLRIVFDASAHDANSLSLNSCLQVGPNLYPEIFDILLRFRLNPVAFTTDMKQAFLQILIDKRDRDVTRFLFSDDPSDESKTPEVYKFSRVLFGISSSPFLLAATIKHHLKKYTKEYPNTVKFLNENVYVDDIIGSHHTVHEALSTSLQSIDIFKDASMELHKWRTNSQVLGELWKEKGIITDANLETFGEQNLPYKVLGIAWNNFKDVLYYDVRGLLEFVSRRIDTKRFVLQVLGRIFDPIGFLGPFTLRIKCLMQQIWSLGIDWDENLPEDLSLIWKSWCNEIPQLSNFSVPRYYFSEINGSACDLELHLFADSSTKAYGTVAYLRATTSDKNVQTVFIASKNRVAPLKTLTLPRLELMAALLSAKLSKSILEALNLKITTYYWTDSKITYFWIRGSPEKFKPFVKNRVEEIRKLTSPKDWYHCPGTVNPADIVSRGTRISTIVNDKLWLHGPEWLRLSPEFWPQSEGVKINYSDELEYRKKPNEVVQYECLVEKFESPIDISKYSDFEKLLRVTAMVKKFILKLKKIDNARGVVTTEEMFQAENFLIQSEQKQYFREEFEALMNKKRIDKNSSLKNFTPFLDENQLIRLGGRLELSDLPTDEKHPIILPKKSWLTFLIVRREHEKIMHGGTSSTLAKLRNRFWVPKGRQLVKSVIKKCLICQKYASKPTEQITAPLPKDRITEAPPFSVCGLDFAGPIYVKNFKEIEKSYIVLFTCGVTRALHLEIVSNMTTNSFLLAFRRFIARRGNCKVIYSDNALSFKKAKREIEDLSKIMCDKSLLNFVTKERIVWKNIIERGAWWGGFYERLVKSVKECLRKIVGKALLNFEEMSTLLVEIEAVLNFRPLTYVYNEHDEPQPLTPSHFLNPGKDPTYPVSFAEILENASKRTSLLKRKKYLSLLLKQIWSKWKHQYLLDLKTAHSLENPNKQTELKVGDVVLIEENTKNKLLWKLGKIEKVFIGRDNNVRSCEIRTSSGLFKRAVQHLYPLEIL